MKPHLSTRLALAGTFALFTHTTRAQTWQTVSDFQYGEVPNQPGWLSTANAMALDAQGAIYVAGRGTTNGARHGLVTRSSDQGVTWTLIQDFTYPTNTAMTFTAVGLDARQDIYAVGIAGINAATRLIVRKSADAGASWTTALDVPIPNAYNPDLYTAPEGSPGFAADAAGAIYVSVAALPPIGSLVWCSLDAGVTWSSANEGMGHVGGIALTAAGLFAADWASSYWGTVKRSDNGGLTWPVVNSYTPPNFNGTGTLQALGSDMLGNLYVGGFAYLTTTTGSGRHATSITTTNWVVRKGNNSGLTWSTLALMPTGSASSLNAVGADHAGNLYAVGAATFPGNTSAHWLVQKSVNQGASWTLVDDFQYPYNGSGVTSVAKAIICDATGAVYVCGNARNHWVVRKQVGP
jgi:hypothetical protein